MSKSICARPFFKSSLVASTATFALLAIPFQAMAQEIVVKPGETRALAKQAKPVDGISVKSGVLTATDVTVNRTEAKKPAIVIESGGRVELNKSTVTGKAEALAATVNTAAETNFVITNGSTVSGAKEPLLAVTRSAQGDAAAVNLVIANGSKASGDILDTSKKAATGYTDVRIDNARLDGGVSGVRNVTLANGGVWGAAGKTDLAALRIEGAGAIDSGTADILLASPISGTGAFAKRGASALTLKGDSSFTGATTVEAGKLVVNGRLPSAVTVANKATLSGDGRIASLTVASGGIVAPGNGIGTLTVDGNVNLAAGSVYQVEFDGQGRSDLIAARGAATLGGGTLSLAPLTDTGYVAQASYTVLTAAGGVSGKFGTITGTENLPFLTATVNYDPQAVRLQLARNNVAFARIATTPNQTAVATALDAGGAASGLNTIISRQSRSAALRTFDALGGSTYATTASVLFDQSQKVGDLVLGRLRQADLTDATLDPQHRAGGRVALWGQAMGSWASPKGTRNAPGFDRHMMGLIGGIDAGLGGWRIGAAYAHGWTDLNVANGDRGRLRTDTVSGYGGGALGPIHVRAGGAYSWHRIGTDRHIDVPGFKDDLRSRYKAHSLQAFGEASIPVPLGAVVAEPFAGVNYIRLKSDGFSETGGLAALRGSESKHDVTYMTLGMRAAANVPVDGTVISPYASAAWRRAFGDRDAPQQLAFVRTGQSFLIGGVPVTRSSVALEAGVQANILPRGSLSFGYTGNLSKRWKDNGLKLGFAYGF